MGNVMNDKDKKNIHNGHRIRMKTRFLENSFDGFAPHEVMEFMLFFAIPNGNVNPLGHELINHFGSVKGVLDADIDELRSIKGVGDHTAIMLKLFNEVFRYTSMEKYDVPKGTLEFDELSFVGNYFTDYFIGATVEKAVIALLDENKHLITTVEISEGTYNVCAILQQSINEYLHKYKARYFVLAHNHPNGPSEPSLEDRATSISLSQTFGNLGTPMLEHIVVHSKKWHAIMSNKYGVNTTDDESTSENS